MKIGINASFVRKPGTGIGQVSINFLKKLSETKSQHEFVLYLEEPLPRNFKLPQNFETRIFLPFWKRDDLIRKIWWEKYLLPQKIRQDKCDLFFSLYQCPTVLPKSIKHIMLIHDIIPKLFPEYLNNFRKKIYQNLIEKSTPQADRIITISKKTEKDLVQHFAIPGDKITTSYIDVDPLYKKIPSTEKINKVLKKYHLKPGYILGGVGLDKRKNVDTLIKAYHQLWKNNSSEFKPPKLVVVGKLRPEMAPLIIDVEKLVTKLNLKKQVKLLGFVPQENMPALYNQAALFVYPSLYEGFGLPVLEAINQKTPVLTAKTSSLPEVGRDAILYCNPEDTEEIARIIKKVLKDKKLRDVLSVRGIERAQQFSWENFVKKFLHLIDQI